jgi:uncharacterized protein YndB with AHSA1/START domain
MAGNRFDKAHADGILLHHLSSRVLRAGARVSGDASPLPVHESSTDTLNDVTEAARALGSGVYVFSIAYRHITSGDDGGEKSHGPPLPDGPMLGIVKIASVTSSRRLCIWSCFWPTDRSVPENQERSPMENAGTLNVTTPSDRTIALTRVLDAPPWLVFDAWTKPELLKRWLGVRGGWSLAVCEIDLRVGGTYRFVWRGRDGVDMGVRGVYREIVTCQRLVYTESFDESWYPGEALVTTALVGQGARTTLTSTILYESREARDAVLKTPMERGVAESYDKLAELLASAVAPRIRREV